jgi:N-acyl-phosphatidylethanolamine-hydrolysing phospholipase D
VTAPHHHTPRRFRNNYVSSVTKSLGDVLRWQLQRLRAGLPAPPTLATPHQKADLDFIHRNAHPQHMTPASTWIGHATTLMQASGLNVLTDPLFLTPLGLKTWLRALRITNAVELDWWQHHSHNGVDFHCTPAQHWSGLGLHDRNQTLWCAWAVLGADFHWFFSGDTGYSQDFADTRRYLASRQSEELGGGFDVALIAIGACLPRWFMSLQHVDLNEAVQVHLDLGAKRSLGVHWGTFSLSDEPLDQPLHELHAARLAKGVAEGQFFILPIGATRCIEPRSCDGVRSN